MRWQDHRWRGLVAIIAVASLAGACESGDGPSPASPTPQATAGVTNDSPQTIVRAGEPIRIGVSAGLSGDLALLGTPIRDAVLLALEDLPRVEDAPLQLIAEDDLCTGPGSEAAAAKLIAAGVVAVIGPMCAGGAVATLDDYARAQIAMISASASNGSVTKQGATNFVRTIWSDDTEGEEIARYIVNALAMRRATLVHDGSPAATSLVTAVHTTLGELGVSEAIREQLMPEEAAAGVTAARIANARPDIVVFAGAAEGGALLAHLLRAAGYTGAIMTADRAASQDFIDLAGADAEGAYLSEGTQAISSRYEAFLAEYRVRYGPDAGTAYIEYAYDAMLLLHEAVRAVATTDDLGNLTIDRVRLIEAVKHARLENGASGMVAFTANGDRDIGAGGINPIYQVRGGVLVRVQ